MEGLSGDCPSPNAVDPRIRLTSRTTGPTTTMAGYPATHAVSLGAERAAHGIWLPLGCTRPDRWALQKLTGFQERNRQTSRNQGFPVPQGQPTWPAPGPWEAGLSPRLANTQSRQSHATFGTADGPLLSTPPGLDRSPERLIAWLRLSTASNWSTQSPGRQSIA